MITEHAIRLARFNDAHAISRMSRDYIERGLGWGWTPMRVLKSIRIRDRCTNVAVIHQGGNLLGFGIMRYDDCAAHLLLLAVHPARRRRGMASALVAWLEAVARTAGIEAIRVETRAGSAAARAFYRALGYAEVGRLHGYYRGVEDAVRFEKRLWHAVAHRS
jgi:ribosomal-protein-alanine N-acetyltransferase